MRYIVISEDLMLVPPVPVNQTERTLVGGTFVLAHGGQDYIERQVNRLALHTHLSARRLERGHSEVEVEREGLRLTAWADLIDELVEPTCRYCRSDACASRT